MHFRWFQSFSVSELILTVGAHNHREGLQRSRVRKALIKDINDEVSR